MFDGGAEVMLEFGSLPSRSSPLVLLDSVEFLFVMAFVEFVMMVVELLA